MKVFILILLFFVICLFSLFLSSTSSPIPFLPLSRRQHKMTHKGMSYKKELKQTNRQD